jgi:uncharacterized cupredoxin-like copper-binding protein
MGSRTAFPAEPTDLDATLPLISYDAFEYGFRGPDQIKSGMITLQVVDTGQASHQMQLIKLEGGHTAADFAASIKASPRKVPLWARLMGGPNGVMPGTRTHTVQNVAPGDYVLVCWMPDSTGVPHLALGMTKSITVTEAGSKPDPVITPDATITLHDYSYDLSKPITAGHRTIEVVNRGQDVHETLVVQLPTKGSVKAFGDSLTPGKRSATAPLGKPVGGVVGLAPGDHALFHLDFAPGHYGLLCLFPDLKNGRAHFEKGMALEFDVK